MNAALRAAEATAKPARDHLGIDVAALRSAPAVLPCVERALCRLAERRDVALDDAESALLAAVRAAGRERDLLRELATRVFSHCWRSAKAAKAVRRSPARPRCADVAPLQNATGYLASLLNVEGRWMRLGDMRGTDVGAAAAWKRREARSCEATATALDEVAAMAGSKRVADVFDEAGLAKIFRRTGATL